VKPQHRYKISIRLNEYRQERTLRGRLRITTDDPESPVREMRVYAQFGGPKNPRVTGAAAKPTKGKTIPAVRKNNGGKPVKQGGNTKPGSGIKPKTNNSGSKG